MTPSRVNQIIKILQGWKLRLLNKFGIKKEVPENYEFLRFDLQIIFYKIKNVS